MSESTRRPVLAAAVVAAFVTAGAAADDAGERAFANELRILPAFTAHLVHTVIHAETSRRDEACLEMDPARAVFRLRYETLPIEILRLGRRVVTVPSGDEKPPRERAESAGKLAALLFMVGSRAPSTRMEVTFEPRQTQVDYVLSPRNDGNPIAWIRYEFDDVGLLRASVLERSGALHRIEFTERKLHPESERELGGEAIEAPAAATVPA